MKSDVIATDAYDVFNSDDIGDFIKVPRDGGFSFAVITGIDTELDLEHVYFHDPFHNEDGYVSFSQAKFMSEEEGKIVSSKLNRPAVEVLLEWKNNNQTVLNAATAKSGSESPRSPIHQQLSDTDALCITSRSGRKSKWSLPLRIALSQAKEYWRPSHPWMKGVKDEIFHRRVLQNMAFDEKGDLRFLASWGEQVREIGNGVYRFPLFSKAYCDWLITMSEERGFWKKERGDQYAAMETRLATISPWLDATHTQIIAGNFINQICSALFENWRINYCDEPFIIKYCKEVDTIHTHCDGDSVLTMIVHLGGKTGGTQFPNINLTVDDLEVGEAILFCGGAPIHEHRSLPSEDRHVLVYWMS